MSDSSVVRGSDPSPRRTGPRTFFRQVMAELRKVVWPTQEQLVTYFFVVMVFVLVMMMLIAALDLGFGKLMFWAFTGASDSGATTNSTK